MTARKLSTWITLAGLGVTTLLGLGCAFGEVNWSDPLKRGFTLKDAQRRYTEYVRWSAFDKASNYVKPEQRDDYMARAPSARELRFTDYEMDPFEINEETGEATIEVTYYAYQLNSPVEVTVTETQHWQRSGTGNNWVVEPSFADLGD